MRATKLLAAAILFSAMTLTVATAQQPKAPTENDYYRMVTFPLPDGLVLELSGLGWLDKEQTRLIACTRRGELWLIENPYSDQPALTGQKINVTDAAGKTSQVRSPSVGFSLNEFPKGGGPNSLYRNGLETVSGTCSLAARVRSLCSLQAPILVQAPSLVEALVVGGFRNSDVPKLSTILPW